MLEASLEIRFNVPNFASNSDIYAAADQAAHIFNGSHLEIVSMAIYGLPMTEEESDHNG